jgi:hypothetical protein
MLPQMRVLLSLVVVLGAGCLGIAGEMPMDDAGLAASGGGSAALDSGSGSGGGSGGGDSGTQLENDAGTPDAGPVDSGTPVFDAGSDRIPVFIAVGKQGRRAISCDDGRTWKNDISVDDAWPANERYRCFSGDFTLPDGGTQGTDCDHNAYSSTSLVHVNGAFIQTMGWGAPGTFFRTTDGITWQQVNMGANVTDVMVGNNRLIAATRYSRQSDDQGLTWTSGAEIDVSNGTNTIWNIRGGGFGGSTFLVTAQDGSNLDFQYSRDNGATWQRPTMVGGGRVDICGAGKPAYGNGVFVTATWSQSMNATAICRSSDAAATWSSSTVADNFESRILWNGTQFIAWSSGKVHRSTDGITWTSTNTQTRVNGTLSGGPNIGAVAINADGTLVGVKGGWQVWYEQQRFYRSTDGVIWDELATGNYKQGHPITAMAAGFASRSAVCP